MIISAKLHATFLPGLLWEVYVYINTHTHTYTYTHKAYVAKLERIANY